MAGDGAPNTIDALDEETDSGRHAPLNIVPNRELSDMWFEARCTELGDTHGLSLRERDVLKLLAQGYSSARIQTELYIAPGTVNYHTRNIYTKLEVHSKQEVIDLVFDNTERGRYE